MHYGITIPNFGDSYAPRTLAHWARDAERAGWDGFFVWDHVLHGNFPHSDPWIDLAAIALATERIRIGPMVTPLPRRRPVKLARETVTLDHLSNGRLTLGVGSGVRATEWEEMGDEANPKVRAAMLDEGLDLLTRLWSGEPVSFEGRHYTFRPTFDWTDEPGRMLPVPLQSPRIPIWIAGTWPNKPPFRRAARWDGVYAISASPFAEGLSPDDVRAMTAFIADQRASDIPFDIVVDGPTPTNDPARASEIAATYAEAGATWWLEEVSPWSFGWDRRSAWPTERMHERILAGPPSHR